MSEKGENCLLQLSNPQDDIRKYQKYTRRYLFTEQPFFKKKYI